MAAPLRHDFPVRNFRKERLEIRIAPAFPAREGATRFFVSEGECVESFLVFADQCRYELCAVGFRTGLSNGRLDISGCAPAGIVFETDRLPVVDGVASCQNCPYLPCPDDTDDTEVFISRFIGTAQSGCSSAANPE